MPLLDDCTCNQVGVSVELKISLSPIEIRQFPRNAKFPKVKEEAKSLEPCRPSARRTSGSGWAQEAMTTSPVAGV